MQNLTADKLNAFYATLLESGRRDGKGLSPKTVRNIHVVIRKALGDAIRWGKVGRNPAELADPPKLRASKRIEMETWDAGELCSFLDFAQDDDLYPAWHLDANTGLRRGVLLGLKRAGLPRMSLKGLRHTHASLALEAGVPVKVVSERLGHASTSFTMDTYAHVLPGMQEDAAEVVASLVARSRAHEAEIERGANVCSALWPAVL